MIGQGWGDEEPSVRPEADPPTKGVWRVMVVTGTRAEFGLLVPVMEAIKDRADLELVVVAAGSHLLQPELTVREVKARYVEQLVDLVPMQIPGRATRDDDVAALARGIAKFGRALAVWKPDWTVVLGDRIEAFAAASAAAIGGRAVAHIHGGDRAEGVADESMRHAISKLAHLHLAATPQSAHRLRSMGEEPSRVFCVGSPAVDGIGAMAEMEEEAWRELGSPVGVFLLHPVGRSDEHEESAAVAALEAMLAVVDGPVLVMDPNHDPGRAGVLRGVDGVAAREARVVRRAHLPRERFVGLLKRMARMASSSDRPCGIMVGNSSAGLIEAAVLRVPVVDVGVRQAGRERAENAVSPEHGSEMQHHVEAAIRVAGGLDRARLTHPYGEGKAGVAVARLLATTNPHEPRVLRKRCAY